MPGGHLACSGQARPILAFVRYAMRYVLCSTLYAVLSSYPK